MRAPLLALLLLLLVRSPSPPTRPRSPPPAPQPLRRPPRRRNPRLHHARRSPRACLPPGWRDPAALRHPPKSSGTRLGCAPTAGLTLGGTRRRRRAQGGAAAGGAGRDPIHIALFTDRPVGAVAVVNSTLQNTRDPERVQYHIVVSNAEYLETLDFHLDDPSSTPIPKDFEVEFFGRMRERDLRGAQVHIYDLKDVSDRLAAQGFQLPWLQPEFTLREADFSVRPAGRAGFAARPGEKLNRFWRENEPNWSLLANHKHKHPLNHLRFFLPYIAEALEGTERLLFVDDDIIIQKDVAEVWDAFDLEGKVMGATCVFPKPEIDHTTGKATQIFETKKAAENLWALNLPSAEDVASLKRGVCLGEEELREDPVTRYRQIHLGESCLPPGFLAELDRAMLEIEGKTLDWDSKAGFNFGFNLFDVARWKAVDLTGIYEKWLTLSSRERIWAPSSMGYGLGLGWLALYEKIHCWDHKLEIIEGLGVDAKMDPVDPDDDEEEGEDAPPPQPQPQLNLRIPMKYLEQADLLHYNGDSKPWNSAKRLAEYYPAWQKYVRNDNPAAPRQNPDQSVRERIRQLEAMAQEQARMNDVCARAAPFEVGPQAEPGTHQLVWLQLPNSGSDLLNATVEGLLASGKHKGVVPWDCNWPHIFCRGDRSLPALAPGGPRWRGETRFFTPCPPESGATQCDNFLSQLEDGERAQVGFLHGLHLFGSHQHLGDPSRAVYLVLTMDPVHRLHRTYRHVIGQQAAFKDLTFAEFLEHYPASNEVTKQLCGGSMTGNFCFDNPLLALAAAKHNLASVPLLTGDFLERPLESLNVVLSALGVEVSAFEQGELRRRALAVQASLRDMAPPALSTREAELVHQKFWSDLELHRHLRAVLARLEGCAADRLGLAAHPAPAGEAPPAMPLSFDLVGGTAGGPLLRADASAALGGGVPRRAEKAEAKAAAEEGKKGEKEEGPRHWGWWALGALGGAYLVRKGLARRRRNALMPAPDGRPSRSASGRNLSGMFGTLRRSMSFKTK